MLKEIHSKSKGYSKASSPWLQALARLNTSSCAWELLGVYDVERNTLKNLKKRVVFVRFVVHALCFRLLLAAVVFVYLSTIASYVSVFFLYTVRWRTTPETGHSVTTWPSWTTSSWTTRYQTPSSSSSQSSSSLPASSSSSTAPSFPSLSWEQPRGRDSRWGRVRTRSTNQTARWLVYVICVLPDAAGALSTCFLPEFHLYRKYHRIFLVFYNILYVLSALNSSVNFFAYLALSSKYRTTLTQMFPRCKVLFPRNFLAEENKTRQADAGRSSTL